MILNCIIYSGSGQKSMMQLLSDYQGRNPPHSTSIALEEL